MLPDQLYALISTIIIALLAIALAVVIVQNYLRKNSASKLFWSLGMITFAVSTVLQIPFAYGIYSTLLISLYLFLVVLLVQLFALGSIQMVKNGNIRHFYYGFTIFASALTLYSIVSSKIGNLLIGNVVAGLPPDFVLWASSIATFPAALVIIVCAGIAYQRTKQRKLLSIIAGVIVVSIAGTLYIAAFPAFLYFAEFVGVLLLWNGFLVSK
ncbi:MAG: hypothetical protein KGH53_02575 [Candidatus Micrarchaeota archaeon]|nr:hypothetical protein [Candidatus Micrarchaeota archaeon]